MTTRTPRRRKGALPPRPYEDTFPVNQAPVDLLQSWLDADGEKAQDQQETFEALRKGIDEERARLGMRRLLSRGN